MPDNQDIRPFVHLHVHSHYSLLDGMSTVPGLVDNAISSGMNAIALTDHGNMFGIKEFYDYVKKKNKSLVEEGKPPFKAILGVEAYCARRSHIYNNTHPERKKEDQGGWHLIILAKNKKGYQNLCKLVSKSWIDGFNSKPRIDKELLTQYHEGLIISSACLGGEIPQKLMGKNARNVDDEEVAETFSSYDDNSAVPEANIRDAEQAVLWFKNLFGNDFYLELQRHETDKPGGDRDTYHKQMQLNDAMLELARRTDTKLIATNDVHFVKEEHAEAHDRLICLSTGKDLDDPRRMHYTKQEWLKTPEEMYKIFSDLPEVLQNTLEIADKVEEYSIDSDAIMPNYEIPVDFGTVEEYKQKFSEEDLQKEFGERFEDVAKGGLDKVYRIKLEADYLESLTMAGAKERYGDNIPEEILERIQFELDTMKTMGFPGYFLIVQDFISAGRKMGISFGPGRGSAAGSVVAYCLKITDIDPLVYDLLFERFLNPDRISMPDIDVDIEADGRGRVLQWVTEKYGKEKVARIVTYGTMAAKSSIKDVARVQKLPLDESNRLAKLVDELPDDKKVNLKNCIEFVPGLKEARASSDANLSSVLEYAEMLEGTVRQTGVHACGVIIGADDLSNFVPLSTADDKDTKEKVIVTQYEGGVIENVGLIKMDFLGLETLDIIKETLKNIKRSRNIDIDIDKIPLDDEETYELFSKGQTVGIFQFESAGMQKYLRELKPSTLDDLIAMNALYRPGPMQYIPSFVNRKHGKEPITYDIPVMEKRLKNTYGITVYQEQVMLLSRDLAGFTRGQSDELRKAMGKKLVEKMPSLKEKFMKGGKGNGYDEKILEKIWSDWAEFAKYAFNKSHATCYAWLAYQTGYLKAHYPSEFMSAILTRSLNDIKEVSKLMDESRGMNIPVKGPDVNESNLNFTVNKSGDIRFGLGGVKGVGSGAVEMIVREREQNGPFKGIFDFVERVNLTACNKKNLEALCLSGAFDNFPEAKREQYFAENVKGEVFMENLIKYGNKFQTDKNSAQNSLFGGFDSVEISRPDIPKAAPWTALERLNKEKELVGIYLSSHPLDDFYIVLNHVCNTGMKEVADDKYALKGREIVMGGIVTGFREGTTKNGKPFGILKLEDYTGTAEIPLFGDDYINYSKFGRQNMYLLIKGQYQPRRFNENELDLRISSIEQLPDVKDAVVQKITINIPIYKIEEELITELSYLIKNNPGNTSLYFKIEDQEKNMYVSLNAENQKYSVSRDLVRYLENKEIYFKIN